MSDLDGLLLAALRLVSFFLASPFPGRFAPIPLRIVLASGLALAFAPDAGTAHADLPAALGEIAIGLSAGFLLSLPLLAFRGAGELAGAQIGLSSGDLFGGVYAIVALGIFALGDGPGQMAVFLSRSFELCPPGAAVLPPPALEIVVQSGRDLLSAALGAAAPVVSAVFAAQLVLGLLGRSLPALNPMIEGPALSFAAGFVGFVSTVHTFIPLLDRLVGYELELAAAWLGA